MQKEAQPKTGSHPFQLVRLLSWSSFVLILGSSLVLSIFIANYARRTVIERQQEFALLLAENLNHQIYQRFTLPTLIGFGRIQLKEKPQYERLDQVVKSTTHSFRILEVRIYDVDQVISYSSDVSLIGKTGLAGVNVEAAMNDGKNSFEILQRSPPLLSFFHIVLDPESVVLRTVYPLRAERGLDPRGPSGPIMGVLEVKQDITSDYETVVNFQILIIVSICLSSLLLFFVLLYLIRRADRVNLQRIAEREQLERELHQNEKLASMGRVVASIAHEIRNPLGIIRSSAELLLSRTSSEKNSANSRILQAIFDEAKRLSKTVNDFLDYARPKPPRQDAVDLGPVLDQMLHFVESECDKRGVKVVKEYQPGLTILGDKDLLYRAFYNIVANAMQAMDGSGEIRIKGETKNGSVVLSFEDSGPGFDPATKDKLLDPFFTTKDTGTGLGLAIVASILQGHKAGLELGDSAAGGARVVMVFQKMQ